MLTKRTKQISSDIITIIVGLVIFAIVAMSAALLSGCGEIPNPVTVQVDLGPIVEKEIVEVEKIVKVPVEVERIVEVEKIGGVWVNTTDKYRDFHDAKISVSLSIPLDKYFTLTPTIAYSFPLSDNADDLISSYNEGLGYSSDSDYFYGGLIMSMSF